MTSSFDPETAENMAVVEQQWAMTAMRHAETHMKLLKARDPKELRFTPLDAELYDHFRREFPEMQVHQINETDLKSADSKVKWRNFMETYKDRIHDYNFGTLLRINAKGDYTEDNSIFGEMLFSLMLGRYSWMPPLVLRTQFYAIEVARNKEGHNEQKKD